MSFHQTLLVIQKSNLLKEVHFQLRHLKEKLLDQKKIENNLKPKLAKFKQPKYYIFVERLPRNTMGKVQKAILREQFKEVFKI